MLQRGCPKVQFPQDTTIQINNITAADKWQICSLPSLWFLAPITYFVWVLMLQLPTAANTGASSFCHFSKFKWFKEVSDLPQSRYKEEGRATRSRAEGVHLFLAAGSYYISSALCWARTINTGYEAASSIVSALPIYSFNVSTHRATRILLSKIPSWIYAIRICLLIQVKFCFSFY